MTDSREIEDSGKKVFTKKVIVKVAASLIATTLTAFLVSGWDFIQDMIYATEISVSIQYQKKSHNIRHEDNKRVVNDRFDSNGGTKRWSGQDKVAATAGWTIVPDSISLRIEQFGRHGGEPPTATIEAIQDVSFTVNWAYTAAGATLHKRNAGIFVYASYDETMPIVVSQALPTQKITIRGKDKSIQIAQLDRDVIIENVQIVLPDQKPIKLSELNREEDGFSYSFDPNTGNVILNYQ